MSAHHTIQAPERSRVTPTGLAGRGKLLTLAGAALCALALVLGLVQDGGMRHLQHSWLLAVTFLPEGVETLPDCKAALDPPNQLPAVAKNSFRTPLIAARSKFII